MYFAYRMAALSAVAFTVFCALAPTPADAQSWATDTAKAEVEAKSEADGRAETPDTPRAAYIRTDGPKTWPTRTMGRVDDGFRPTTFPDAEPPKPESIKLVVMCGVRETVTIHVTGLSYPQPRLLGGLKFEVDRGSVIQNAALNYSESDDAWFPVTAVTRDDPLLYALRMGLNATVSVVGNAADGRSVKVPLTGSRAAIDATLDACDAPYTAW